MPKLSIDPLHRAQLNILKKSTPSNRKRLIKEASPQLVKIISECCLNLLKGNIPVSKNQKTKLKKYQKAIRKLGNSKKLSIKARKNILIQKGGFLPLILGPLLGSVIPLIVKGIGSLIRKRHQKKR